MSTNLDNFVTEVCGYQGHVYTREVGPNDTTVYMDEVYSSIPFKNGVEDADAIAAAIVEAEEQEGTYCPYCKCYGFECD